MLAQEGPGKFRPAHELLEEGVVAVGWWIRHKGESYAGEKDKTNRIGIENQWILLSDTSICAVNSHADLACVFGGRLGE